MGQIVQFGFDGFELRQIQVKHLNHMINKSDLGQAYLVQFSFRIDPNLSHQLESTPLHISSLMYSQVMIKWMWHYLFGFMNLYKSNHVDKVVGNESSPRIIALGSSILNSSNSMCWWWCWSLLIWPRCAKWTIYLHTSYMGTSLVFHFNIVIKKKLRMIYQF